MEKASANYIWFSRTKGAQLIFGNFLTIHETKKTKTNKQTTTTTTTKKHTKTKKQTKQKKRKEKKTNKQTKNPVSKVSYLQITSGKIIRTAIFVLC